MTCSPRSPSQDICLWSVSYYADPRPPPARVLAGSGTDHSKLIYISKQPDCNEQVRMGSNWECVCMCVSAHFSKWATLHHYNDLPNLVKTFATTWGYVYCCVIMRFAQCTLERKSVVVVHYNDLPNPVRTFVASHLNAGILRLTFCVSTSAVTSGNCRDNEM